jgi:hypothetical protein
MKNHALHLLATARARGCTPRSFGDHLDPRGHPRTQVCIMVTRTLVRRPPSHPPVHAGSHARAPRHCKRMRGTSQQLSARADPLPAGLETTWTPTGTHAHHYAANHYHGTVVVAATTASPSSAPGPRARTPSIKLMRCTYKQLPARADPLLAALETTWTHAGTHPHEYALWPHAHWSADHRLTLP